MADFSKFKVGNTSYNVKDANAGRSLSVSGTDLSLNNAAGTAISTVTLPGGGNSDIVFQATSANYQTVAASNASVNVAINTTDMPQELAICNAINAGATVTVKFVSSLLPQEADLEQVRLVSFTSEAPGPHPLHRAVAFMYDLTAQKINQFAVYFTYNNLDQVSTLTFTPITSGGGGGGSSDKAYYLFDANQPGTYQEGILINLSVNQESNPMILCSDTAGQTLATIADIIDELSNNFSDINTPKSIIIQTNNLPIHCSYITSVISGLQVGMLYGDALIFSMYVQNAGMMTFALVDDNGRVKAYRIS